jgi:hypothetical protein
MYGTKICCSVVTSDILLNTIGKIRHYKANGVIKFQILLRKKQVDSPIQKHISYSYLGKYPLFVVKAYELCKNLLAKCKDIKLSTVARAVILVLRILY